ncbi:MAG: FtsL-like putative cell division protein [Chloroflexota bacterium]
MAVYQGTRPYSPLFPGRLARRDAAPALPRRRLRGAVRAGRRPGRVGLLLGGIVLVFLLAFFWLAQTVRVSATSYDIDRLSAEREQLEAQVSDLQSDLNRLGREPAIRKLATDAGMGQLAEPLVVPVR